MLEPLNYDVFEDLLMPRCKHCGEEMEIDLGYLVICHCPGALRADAAEQVALRRRHAERAAAAPRRRGDPT